VREKLAMAGEEPIAPNRNPPPVVDELGASAVPVELPADAAE